MSETSENPHTAHGLRKSAGERLKRARELKGFSQKDVASALNLMVSHVRAIELNRYDASREGDHFNSYLRSYAELVHLNPEQIVDLYREYSRQQNEAAVAVALDLEEESNGISKLFLAGVCLCLAAWLAFRFWPGTDSLDALDPTIIDDAVAGNAAGNKADTAGGAVSQKRAIDSIERQARGGAGAEDPVVIAVPSSVGKGEEAPLQPAVIEKPAVSEQVASTDVDADAGEKAAAAKKNAESLSEELAQQLDKSLGDGGADVAKSSIVERQLEIATREAQTAPAAKGEAGSELLREQQVVAMVQGLKPAAGSADVATGLAFAFSDDCWLDVRDSANKSIFNGVKKSGETLNLQGEAPFDVLIGRSKAVTHMSYKGQSIEVRQHKYSDSTRLIVGGEAALALDVTGKQRPATDASTTTPSIAAATDAAKTEAANAEAASTDEPQDIQPAAGRTASVKPLPAPEPKTSVEQAEEIASLNTTLSDQAAAAGNEAALQLPAGAAVAGNTPGQDGADELQFQFAAECWVEVYDADKRPLFMNTGAAGETLKLSGSAPFEVRLGNSRAVRLSYNGQPVRIDHHASISSSELIVGSR